MDWINSLLIKANHVLSDEQTTEIVHKVASKAPYVTGSGTMILGLTADEWSIVAVIVGIAATVITAGFNIWFNMKYRRGKK